MNVVKECCCSKGIIGIMMEKEEGRNIYAASMNNVRGE